METTTGAVRQLGPDLSHGERDACLHALGALHAAGKLSLSELDARIEAALAARTSDELAALVRESSQVEVAPRRPARSEPRPGAHRSGRTGGWLSAPRFVLLAAVTLLVALVRVLSVAAVALGAGTVRLLQVTAHGGRLASQALGQRTRTPEVACGAAHPLGATEGSDPASLKSRPSASQELVLAPRPQVPAQREPVKIHPVLVPTEVRSSSTDLVLANRSTDVAPVLAAGDTGEMHSRAAAPADRVLPPEDRRVRKIVLHLRPLAHRVAERARGRRAATSAREQVAHERTWQPSVRIS